MKEEGHCRKKGLFITIEGSDGSGKSTQIQLLRDFFEKKKIPVLVTREPGGTAIGEQIRSIILNRSNKEMSAMTEVFLYAASRAQPGDQVIQPALLRGETVICDRFLDSSIAYQGYGRGLGGCVAAINQYAVEGCLPDITFLLKLNPEIGKRRIGKGEEDRIEAEALSFHQTVYNGYLELERSFPQRIIGIDATRSVEEVFEEIQRHVLSVFSLQEEE